MEIMLICSFAHKGLAKYAPLSKQELFSAQKIYLEALDKNKPAKSKSGTKKPEKKLLHLTQLSKKELTAKSSSIAPLLPYLTHTSSTITSRTVGRKNELTILDKQNKRLLTYNPKTKELTENTRFTPFISQTECVKVWKRPEGYVYLGQMYTKSSESELQVGILPNGSNCPKKIDCIVDLQGENVRFTRTGGLALICQEKKNERIYLPRSGLAPPKYIEESVSRTLVLLDLKTGMQKMLLDPKMHPLTGHSAYTLYEDTVYVCMHSGSNLLKVTNLSRQMNAKPSIFTSPGLIGVKDAQIVGLECCQHGLILYKRLRWETKAVLTLVDAATLVQKQIAFLNDDQSDNQPILVQRSLVFKTKLNLSVVLIMQKECMIHLLIVRPEAIHVVVTNRKFAAGNGKPPASLGVLPLSVPVRSKVSHASQRRAVHHTLLCFSNDPDRNIILRLRLP